MKQLKQTTNNILCSVTKHDMLAGIAWSKQEQNIGSNHRDGFNKQTGTLITVDS